MRAAVVLSALLVVAWLGVLERDRRVQRRAQAETVLRDPASFFQADRDYRASRFLNPDRTSDVLRAYMYVARRGPEPGIRLAKGVFREEPDNIELLSLLATVPAPSDPGIQIRARERLRQFDPALR